MAENSLSVSISLTYCDMLQCNWSYISIRHSIIMSFYTFRYPTWPTSNPQQSICTFLSLNMGEQQVIYTWLHSLLDSLVNDKILLPEPRELFTLPWPVYFYSFLISNKTAPIKVSMKNKFSINFIWWCLGILGCICLV